MRIRWTEPAAHDFTQICDYIQEQSSKNLAPRLAPGGKAGTRELILPASPYLAVYRIQEGP
jgi:plasmid stabilization system protein ParE